MIDNINNVSFGARVTVTKNPKRLCPQSVQTRLTPEVLNSIKAKTKECPGSIELADTERDFLVATYKGANFYIPQTSFKSASDETIIDAFVKIIQYLKTRAKLNNVKRPTKQDYIMQNEHLKKIITDNTLFFEKCRVRENKINAYDIEERNLFMDEINRRHGELAREMFG